MRTIKHCLFLVFLFVLTACQAPGEGQEYERLGLQMELTQAAGAGSIAEVDRLIARGASLQEPYSMQAAVLHRQPQMVRHLIARGAPINGTGVIQSPLWFAVTHGDTAMAELLIALGADVNWQTNDMGSPLHAALYSSSAGGNRLALARLLLEHKADVNAIQNYPMFRNRCLATPLHAAVFSLDKAAVELLIKHGADLNATDRNGRTATQCARERLAVIKFNPLQLKEIIELLEAEQARVR